MVRLSGEYDTTRRAALHNQLTELYDADLPLLDMRDVTAVDATCSVVFREVAEGLRATTPPRMVGARSGLLSQLRRFGLDETFDQYATLKDALEDLR